MNCASWDLTSKWSTWIPLANMPKQDHFEKNQQRAKVFPYSGCSYINISRVAALSEDMFIVYYDHILMVFKRTRMGDRGRMLATFQLESSIKWQRHLRVR